MSPLPGGLACRTPGRFGGPRRFLDCDEAQGERWTGFAPNPYGLVDLSAGSGVLELREQADRLPIGAEPTRIPPAGPHDDIGASFKNCYA